MSVIEEIAAERRRQTEVEGWTSGHDDEHRNFEMAIAAAAYVMTAAGFARAAVSELWPKAWGVHWLKPTTPRRDLIKAAALIVAEIERLDRASAPR